MGTIKIGYRNHADDAVLSASAQYGTKPASLLQDPHIRRRWSAGPRTSAWVNLAWAAPVAIDCVALFGSNLTWDGGRCRVTMSNANGGADLYDSGDAAARVDPRFGYLIHVLPDTVAASTLRLYLSDPAVSELRGGRLFAGPLWSPTHNDSFGRKFGRAPTSTQTVGRAGQMFPDRRANPRAASFSLGWIAEAEERTHLRELQRLCANADDLLAIFDPDDANPGDASIWGWAKDLQLPSLDHPGLSSATFTITERL